MNHYKNVPKTLAENLDYRAWLKAKCQAPAAQAQVRWACSEDPLYWLNVFGWVFEPRKQVDLPFITWECQDEQLLKTQECIEAGRDLVQVKARDMGATWTDLALLLWRWQFLKMQSIGICSRVDELVELSGNPDTLFWKLDMLIERQPKWLLPKFNRWRKRLLNTDLRCDIKGYATTSDIARGGRRLCILADELAAYDDKQGFEAMIAMQGATNCVLMPCTPKGASGAFHDMYKRSQSGGYHRRVECIRIPWTQHPEKKLGLYTNEKGAVVILDKAFPFPPDYPFHLGREGKFRSPAYDAENERKSDQFMAQEWDMDFAGAGSAFFDPDFLANLQKDCRPARQRGRLVYDHDTLEPSKFVDDPHGNLWLWCTLINGEPVPVSYGVGCDISAGTGATPSTMAVASLETGEKVAEFADPRRMPHDFARDAVAVCKWFHNAKLIWEATGPGSTFGRVILELRNVSKFSNLYYNRSKENSLTPKATDTPGWYSNHNLKRNLFEEWREALGNAWIERSIETLKQAGEYVHSPTGSVDHQAANTTEDPSGARVNHGDLAVASALCNLLVKAHNKHRPRTSELQEPKQIARPGSVAWIIEQEKRGADDATFIGGLKL